MSNSDGLWDWALAAYKREGVSEACLKLQDYFEQNVCLLLWGAWCADTGRLPDEDTLEAAADTARAWETTTVAPLRAVRRTLKAPVPDLDTDARLAVREQTRPVCGPASSPALPSRHWQNAFQPDPASVISRCRVGTRL